MAAKISKRWIINFVLIFLIICLSYVGNKYNVQPGYITDSKISTIKPDEVDSILIQTADQRMQFKRSLNGWNMTNPIQVAANPIKVERLLGITNISTDSRLPASEADLKQFGLESPKGFLRLDETDIHFGKTNNIGERRYIQIHSTIFLIADLQYPLMNLPYFDYLNHRLLTDISTLVEIKLPSTSLIRADNGAWRDSNQKYSPDQTNQLVDHWNKLEARKVRPYDKHLPAKSKVSVRFENSQEITFFVLSINPEIILARPDQKLQYHFAASDYYRLLAIADDEKTTD